MECSKSYEFVEPYIMYPATTLEQSGPDGLYFDWVGLCTNGTLTFGREVGTKSEIVLSFEYYSDQPSRKSKPVFHSSPNLEVYWKNADRYMEGLAKNSPRLYARVLDMLLRNKFSTDRFDTNIL